MEMELSSGDSTSGTTWIKRAEIDTRAPFRSVREAVSLFRDGVLDGKVYARPRLSILSDAFIILQNTWLNALFEPGNHDQ